MPLGGGSMQDLRLAYDRFDPGSKGLREAPTSTGNGYFCTWGTAEWEDAGTVHYPGTHATAASTARPRSWVVARMHNEDLVNLPNWLVLKLRIEGADAIRLAHNLIQDRHANF